MTVLARFAALLVVVAVVSVPCQAQSGSLLGTVIDIDEARGRLAIETDDAEQEMIVIETDAVSTSYYGFGGVIAGKPEIFTGASGLANMRLGDRIQVVGSVDGQAWRARRVTLVGRDVAASTVGVGQTRRPTSATTPTPPIGADVVEDDGGDIEGTVRDINEEEGRLVIQTTGRRLVTVRTYRTTPVYYRGGTYGVTNLEIGDRVRIEADARDAQADEITARRIDVTLAVQDAGPDTATGGRVTTMSGTVTRIDDGAETAYIHTGRGELRLDMRRAEDARGEILRARDLRAGDRLEITGSLNPAGDLFLASTVRFVTGGDGNANPGSADRPAVVTYTGSIVETLADGATLALRERETNQLVRIWVTGDFVITMRNNTTHATARTLRAEDTVVIEAYRDAAGNLIAQTIRVRNR